MYKVQWVRPALDELMDLWLGATPAVRRQITEATYKIDMSLSASPYDQGESRVRGRRILIVTPLAVKYRVDENRGAVLIVAVWRFDKRSN